MEQQASLQRRRRGISLSLRVSLLLMFAAIAPLLVTLLVSELLTRPTLISQANTAMQTDAQSRVQLIDTYLSERMLDAETLTQVPTVQQFLALPPQQVTLDAQRHALYALAAGLFRDHRYTDWALFNVKGNLRLYYPPTLPPQVHGRYLVPPEELQAVTSGKVVISPVYYNPGSHKASVDIYAPISDSATATPVLLGFIRATLNIDYIWSIVNSDKGANGDGSNAFIVDENGVRIADTNPSLLFTATAPLSPDVQQTISAEARYGSSNPVAVKADSKPIQLHQNTTGQLIPAGQSNTYEIAQRATTKVPWTYIVLSPVSTVTAIADRQLFSTCIIAFVVLLIAALAGLGTGQYITRPILQAVERLRRSTTSLNTLATKQQSAASEQTWVIDSSQVGLQSVQYYTEATRIAAHKLREMGTGMLNNLNHQNEQSIRHILAQMINAADYIEKAVHYQATSNEKLATAIKVTTQVNEQLKEGATSASDAAAQLEQVVNELRQVVGK
ncbi:MAG TPA: hypothetical protein VFA41_09685 [Ktedonobacteraceae bacterium]|jgi:prefoldin subunit 5|nr:hypothetical protein [Ktedonobacteraceae bacterium]